MRSRLRRGARQYLRHAPGNVLGVCAFVVMELRTRRTMTRSRLLIAAVLVATVVAIPFVAAETSRGGNNGPNVSDLTLIAGIMQLVQRGYVRPVDQSELTKDALKGMLSRLDPHSDYMDEQEFRESRADLTGQFGGLGIQISEQGGVPKVISPIDDTPAARAGIQPGDLIVAINNEATRGVELSKIVRILRGAPGTTVTLTLSRGSEAPFDVKLTRSIIHVQSVKPKLQADGVGYVRISEFSESTGDEFKKALDSLKQQAGGKLNGLIIDLRNDPGGLLNAAVAVAGDLLDGGTIVTVRGRNGVQDQTFQAPPQGDMLRGTRIVVLINSASASASEIVAGALQDRKRGTVVGTASFGKGSVQTVVPLNGKGALRLTTALYYTPAGRSIQGQGIAPDTVVEAPKEEQVAGAVILRESSLAGAFSNPGPLRRSGAKSSEKPGGTADKEATLSPPIKAELIGGEQDTQLKAALQSLAPRGTTDGAAQ